MLTGHSISEVNVSLDLFHSTEKNAGSDISRTLRPEEGLLAVCKDGRGKGAGRPGAHLSCAHYQPRPFPSYWG